MYTLTPFHIEISAGSKEHLFFKMALNYFNELSEAGFFNSNLPGKNFIESFDADHYYKTEKAFAADIPTNAQSLSLADVQMLLAITNQVATAFIIDKPNQDEMIKWLPEIDEDKRKEFRTTGLTVFQTLKDQLSVHQQVA